MRATAQAQPNIALVKYWGKRDVAANLPAAGSISVTLDTLWTRMTVAFGKQRGNDTLHVNGEAAAGMLPRVSQCLDAVAGTSRPCAVITSDCNFPIAAGLASSASAFAALVVAANRAAGRNTDLAGLARIAGGASGSAARSIYPGIVELHAGADGIDITPLATPADWPLLVTVAITRTEAKATGSGAAMRISERTSPFYEAWIARQDEDLVAARKAIAARDFAALAAVAEHNCLKMHSVMWTSRPALVYWNAATIDCLDTVRRLQDAGVAAFFTIDAGPQVKVLSLPEAGDEVAAALRDSGSVVDIRQSKLGNGACLLDTA